MVDCDTYDIYTCIIGAMNITLHTSSQTPEGAFTMLDRGL